MFDLNGKVALVTGAASGIGAATTALFSEAGASVLATDLVAPVEVAESLERVEAASLDVTDPDQVRRCISGGVQSFGRIDVVVNCAGIGHVGSVQETSQADFDRVMNVNVAGVFRVSAAAATTMLVQEPPGGVIINVASVAGMVGLRRRFAYSASKGAVIAMTRQMAIDFADKGIRVNAVCPGTIDTPFVAAYLAKYHADDIEGERDRVRARQPVGRLGTAEEVAACILYMATEEASFMTGSGVVIDGGLTAG